MKRHKSGLRCSRWFGVTLLIAGMTILSSGSALSRDLPRLITMTSYKVGSLGYMITSGFREAIEKLTPMKVRVEPYGTDVARTLPLKMKESEIALMGGASGTCVSYGIAEFSAKEWGPQPLRQVWRGMNVYTGLVTRGDSGIKHPSDLKGKRIPLVPGWPAGMKGIEGVMAFGNVTWDEVTTVTCSGYTDQLTGVMEGRVDVAYAATITPLLEEMAASPHGLAYISLPHADKEGWARLSNISPWFVPMVVQDAPGLKNGERVEYSGHPYSLWAYDHVDDDIIYEVVKALHKGFDLYKDMHRAMPHWNIHQAVTDPSPVPYHDGAIRYFKEAGVWTSAMDEWQAHQVKLFNARRKQ